MNWYPPDSETQFSLPVSEVLAMLKDNDRRYRPRKVKARKPEQKGDA